jgi:hypothetical protein
MIHGWALSRADGIFGSHNAEKTGHLRYQSVVKDLAAAVAGGAPLAGLPRLLWAHPTCRSDKKGGITQVALCCP